MNIIELETPESTEKYYAPQTDNTYPFYITEYGKTFRNTPCYQLRMNSPVGCVQYVISGSGVILCDDRIYTVSAGDTFLLPEGSNQIYYSNPDNQFERIWFNYKGALGKTLLDIYNLNHTVVFRNVNTYGIFSEIYEESRRLRDAAEYKNLTSRLFLQLVQFLSENRQLINEVTSTIEQIRLYIDCHITENLRISDIAKKFSFSGEHIIRVFRKTYQITPHQYILQSKIRLAMIMLKMKTDSIEEVAVRLGFTDSHHFAKQFKRLTGYKPTEYKKIMV